LPGIPSEVVIQKEGVSLGEINTKLLQKIEELTLYLIEMRHELDQVKANQPAGRKKRVKNW
jgi:hypothetical protein